MDVRFHLQVDRMHLMVNMTEYSGKMHFAFIKSSSFPTVLKYSFKTSVMQSVFSVSALSLHYKCFSSANHLV